MSQADNLAALGSNVNASGVLQPASGGTGVTTSTGTGSVVLSSGATLTNATINGAVASGFTMKNRIINGDMVVSQRNGTSSVTPTGDTYLLDRWCYFASQVSKFTWQQNKGSVTPPTGFTNYLGGSVASAVTIGSSDYFGLFQSIEGFNVADLDFGTANAKTFTLSFKVYSSLTGTFGGALRNGDGSRTYPFTYTISSANTWTTITLTVAGDTSGTWLKTNGTGLQIVFSLGMGSTFSGAAGSWSGSNFYSATGATSVVGTNGATFYLTGVQLEQGSSATSYEWLPYGTELALCQRYFQAQIIDIGNAAILSGNVTNGVSYYGSKTLQVAMRAAPTLTWGTQWGVNGFAASAPTADWLGADGFRFYKAANATTNGGYIFQAWNVSAEL